MRYTKKFPFVLKNSPGKPPKGDSPYVIFPWRAQEEGEYITSSVRCKMSYLGRGRILKNNTSNASRGKTLYQPLIGVWHI